MVDGIFHDAHEVYAVNGTVKQWVATFATKALAEQYAVAVAHLAASLGQENTFEVTPA